MSVDGTGDRPRIVVVGSSNTDLIVRTPRIPAPGETVLGGDLLITPGGKGANQAVAAARLGAEVFLLARIGADMFGDHAVAGLDSAGVVTDFIIRDSEAPSGVALISVDDRGENAIVVAPGSNARLTPKDVDGAVRVFERAHAIILQFEIPLAAVRRAIDLGRELGKTVIVNPAPALTLPDGFLAGVDVLTPNLQEATALLGNLERPDPAPAARALRGLGPRAVAITLGAAGAVYADGETFGTQPAIPAAVKDSTAAGDCFTGALAVAFTEGRPLGEAVRFANAAASIAVTRPGAQASMPSRPEVDQIAW